MPLRSVLDIDVNDAAFNAFYDKFQKYSEESRKLPAIWQSAGRSQGGNNREIERTVGFAERLNRSWSMMRETTGTVARNVREIASRMMHMTSLMAAAGGLATGFGFLGMDALGRQAAGFRRAAMGQGTSIGTMRSFGLNFSRFIDPNAFLGGVSQAMRDPRHSVALSALGIQARPGEDTAAVAARALERAQQLAKTTPESQLGTLLQSHKLGDLGLSLDDLMRLRRMSTEEMRTQQGAFRHDARGLNLTEPQARGWQDFTTTLSRARQEIETTFIVRLSPLAPALGHLSSAFNKVIGTLLSRPELQKWIDDAAAGLNRFAEYVGTPQFQKDVEDFVHGVGDAARAIVSFVKAVGGLVGIGGGSGGGGKGGSGSGGGAAGSPSAPVETPPGQTPPTHGGWTYNWAAGRWEYRRGTADSPVAAPGADRRPEVPAAPYGRLETWMGVGTGQDARAKQMHDYFTGKGYSETATAGLLAYVRGESGFKSDAFNAAGGGQGAQGIGQWRGARIDNFRRMFGHDPRYGSFEEQMAFMDWELRNTEKGTGDALAGVQTPEQSASVVLRQYGRPSAADLATGEGQRQGYAREYSTKFGNHPAAPSGGRMQQSMGGNSHPAHVTVTIRNETGGNAFVTSQQVASA